MSTSTRITCTVTFTPPRGQLTEVAALVEMPSPAVTTWGPAEVEDLAYRVVAAMQDEKNSVTGPYRWHMTSPTTNARDGVGREWVIVVQGHGAEAALVPLVFRDDQLPSKPTQWKNIEWWSTEVHTPEYSASSNDVAGPAQVVEHEQRVRTPSVRRASLVVLVTGAALCAGLWFSAGVTGEVFLVDNDGRVHGAPGAAIVVYSLDGGSFGEFTSSINDVEAEYTRKLLDIVNSESGEFLRLSIEVLNMMHCSQLSDRLSTFFQRRMALADADREGRFFVRLWPGRYVVVARGQAGDTFALWWAVVNVGWRSDLRLVTPRCSYETGNR